MKSFFMFLNCRKITGLIILMLSLGVVCGGCGGSGSSSASFDHITVDEVNSFLDEYGLTGRNTHIVHEDGFGNGGDEMDIGRVILSRISGEYYYDDIFYGFDVKFSGDESEFADDITMVLYLDTDQNSATGMAINGIGADVRLVDTGSNNTLTSGVGVWDDSAHAWDEAPGGGSSDYGFDVAGGAHAYAAIYSTNDLLTEDAEGVLSLEVLTSDNSGTAYRYDATEAFYISAF